MKAKQTRFSTTQFVPVHYYCDKLYAEGEGREIRTCTATSTAAAAAKKIAFMLYMQRIILLSLFDQSSVRSVVFVPWYLQFYCFLLSR